MAQKTRTASSVDREQVGQFLRDLADEFERNDDDLQVRVGNKTVSLSPGETVDLDVEVVERSSWVRKSRESVSIDVSWKR